ncbi:MAG: 1-acyl-sn-glycerol-3-phosphate acyltransferase [Pseudomonadota bacterium]
MTAPTEGLNQQTYDWCARTFDHVRKLLGLRIKLHTEQRRLEVGDIFVFNHFARMETFIPQYLIYRENGAICRSIASAALFRASDRLAELLDQLGVIPNDHPDLMAVLARDILMGRKIVIFPEGGMVKDRDVVDERGELNVFSRHSGTRRKHHTGAARLAVGLQLFKDAIATRHTRGSEATRVCASF